MATQQKSRQRNNQPPQESEDKTWFANPVSKNTFEALPRIYGCRKKKKSIKTDTATKQKTSDRMEDEARASPVDQDLPPSESRPFLSKAKAADLQANSERTHRFKTEMKTYSKKEAQRLSRPRGEFCNKRYCICGKEHHQSQERASHSETKARLNKHLKLLPLGINQAKNFQSPKQDSFQLDEIETNHKVAMAPKTGNSPDSERRHVALLDFLRGNQGQSSPEQKRHQTLTISRGRDSRRSIEVQYPVKMNNISIQTDAVGLGLEQDPSLTIGKTQQLERYTPKPISRKIASSQEQREPVSPLSQKKIRMFEDEKYEESNLPQTLDSDPHKKLAKLRQKFKAIEEEDSSDEDQKSIRSSISSASISKHVFEGGKANTMFHTLSHRSSSVKAPSEGNKSAEAQGKVNKKFQYQKKNGLFVIPEEDEYVPFLKSYEPMNEKFAIKHLVRKENFKVVPSEDGIYFGQLVDEKKHGRGITVTERGIYEGKYKNNQKIYGCEKNVDGVYRGEFVNGVREGYGTFQWYNGEIFEGEWKNGTKNGFGIWKSPKGDFYEGNWLLNRQHGKGIYKHRLSTYRGEFVNFLKEGEGEEYFSNGDKYVGNYKQGKPDGRGKYQWADGSYYEGYFVNGLRHGQGTWVYNNGTIYEGQFKNDFKDGFGREQYKSGEVFQGIFKEGSKYEGRISERASYGGSD